jgi:hypothetical protein
MSDDEQTTSTCFDTESSTGESSAEIQGAAPAATATATSKICPRCMIFWIIVGVIAIGSILYFGRK